MTASPPQGYHIAGVFRNESDLTSFLARRLAMRVSASVVEIGYETSDPGWATVTPRRDNANALASIVTVQ